MFRHVWFRPQRNNRLGSVSFGLLWFSLLLLPVFMILASASLVTLYFVDYQLAWVAFHVLWLTNVITYVFITSFALLIDPATGRRTWVQAVLFPGAVNVVILLAAILPGPLGWVSHELAELGRVRDDRRLGPRHRAVHLHLARRVHGRGVPGQGGREGPGSAGS